VSEGAVRVGVVGVGALGRHHARVWASSPGARLVGVHDIDAARAETVAKEFGCPVHAELDALLDQVQAVSVAVPTVDHHPVGRRALERGCDVLLEKPMTATLAEADDLVALAEEKHAIFQVGHIERFNPATDVLLAAVTAPRFIEVHRLGSFSPRSLDVDVVLDLMIHDLQILHALDDSGIREIRATGIPVLSERTDIANVRLAFESGMVASLTASRVSAERDRKLRAFFRRRYYSMDYEQQVIKGFRLTEEGGDRRIQPDDLEVTPGEPLRLELQAFIRRCRGEVVPLADGRRGRQALATGLAINEQMTSAGGFSGSA
jgi:predicted dehydrogenase